MLVPRQLSLRQGRLVLLLLEKWCPLLALLPPQKTNRMRSIPLMLDSADAAFSRAGVFAYVVQPLPRPRHNTMSTRGGATAIACEAFPTPGAACPQNIG